MLPKSRLKDGIRPQTSDFLHRSETLTRPLCTSEKDLNEKHFFQKKGENVHNFHPRPPSIIVPIATAAHSPTHGESPLLRYQWPGSRQEVNQSWPSYRCSAK